MIGCLFLALTGWGASAHEETFVRAAELYAAGDFSRAAQLFQQLVSEGIADPVVFYNLGNSYYRSERLGLAIANYERALRLQPSLEYARENLAQCVGKTKQRLRRPAPPPWERTLFFWHSGLGQDLPWKVAVSAWGAFWAILALRYWRPMRYLGLLSGVLAVLAVGFGASAWAKAHPASLAVVGAERIPVRYGTNEDDTVRFELYEGDRVVIERREGDWARIRVATGERGWANLDYLILVGPPFPRSAPADLVENLLEPGQSP